MFRKEACSNILIEITETLLMITYIFFLWLYGIFKPFTSVNFIRNMLVWVGDRESWRNVIECWIFFNASQTANLYSISKFHSYYLDIVSLYLLNKPQSTLNEALLSLEEIAKHRFDRFHLSTLYFYFIL